ncbi:hypothetical protein ANCDUO_04262 [Ancylostoma duodenale]|uniref:Uncharacterized protein n=1 Tax=Ancylostoma duodenale TaxID=51022 RepID=A0A0C2GVH8_9BILA|nr:hypothetical protein ANCDUO_04262 [Ancylostoma duodenale]
MPKANRIVDASGRLMRFVTVVELTITDRSDEQKTRVGMHVTKTRDDMIIIGTNAIPALSYVICKEPQVANETDVTASSAKVAASEPQKPERGSYAVVLRRAVVAPTVVGSARVTENAQTREAAVKPNGEFVQARVCALKPEGRGESSVAKTSNKPTVFRGGIVGKWMERCWKERRYGAPMPVSANGKGADTLYPPGEGERVCRKAPRDKIECEHSEKAKNWEGSYRMVETGDTSTMITRIIVHLTNS